MTIQAYVFDAYGTLFDVHAAMAKFAGDIGARSQNISQLWRSKVLEYTWTRTLMESYQDFASLTAQALDFALTAHARDVSPALRRALLDAQLVPAAFGDAEPCLKTLKDAGFKTAILSNGTGAMLEDAVAKAGLQAHIDAIISVDDIKLYKTHPAAYRLMADRLDLLPSQISFQSSNRWDIAGATKAGCRTVWINRSHFPDEYGDLSPAFVVSSLEGLIHLQG